MRIFVLGFPHTQAIDPRDENLINICPFTEQIWYFCQMMALRGHEVIHVGTWGSKLPDGVEHVSVSTKEEWEILYSWRHPLSGFITTIDLAYGEYRKRFAARANQVIRDRSGKPYTSIVGTLWDADHATKDIPQFIVEYGIGYPSASSPWRVYLSEAWRQFHEGCDKNFAGDKYYWTTIPLGINLDLFGPVVPTAEKVDAHGKPYFLVQTRMHEDKGVRWAVQVARALDTQIVLTGREDASSFIAEWPEGVVHLGMTDIAMRRELMRHAKGLFSLTRYQEPYGAVAIEAQASGCPVISTDFGGYLSTVVHADSEGHGGTGWRVNTFEESVWAARNIHKIDPFVCREWIARNHNFRKVSGMYEDYFESVLSTGRVGWTDPKPADGRIALPRAFRDYSMFGHQGAYSSTITTPGLPSPPTAAADVVAAPPPPAANPTALAPAPAAVFSCPPAPISDLPPRPDIPSDADSRCPGKPASP